jgi:hypothetical protein
MLLFLNHWTLFKHAIQQKSNKEDIQSEKKKEETKAYNNHNLNKIKINN